MTDNAIIIIFAYILDLLFGDPQWLPHPVRGIGCLISKSETFLRKRISNERLAGIMLLLFVVGFTYFLSFVIVEIFFELNKVLGMIISILLVYTCLAVKDLGVEAMRVFNALKADDLDKARKNLSMIVGRDTDNLDKTEIIRAAVETVAESVVDGIVSPLFFAFVGGAPLALAYKAINTLDSMVGYKDNRYIRFGWASAKADDVFNFVPARLAAFVLPIAVKFSGNDFFGAVRVLIRDRKNHPSPNSGISEAAVAGGLNIQLGGLNFYNSQPSKKPFIGDKKNDLCISHIKKAITISHLTAVLTILLEFLIVCLLKGG